MISGRPRDLSVQQACLMRVQFLNRDMDNISNLT
jgi:hypothetical protein